MSNPPPNSWQSLAWIVFMILVTALAVVVLCAQPVSAAQLDAAVVLVRDCSGVCVDPSGLVLSVKHGDFAEREPVRFGNTVVSARRIYVSPDPEGPVVFDCDGDGFPYAKVASFPPPVGDKVWAAGYPQSNGQRLVWSSGKMLGRAAMTTNGAPWEGNAVDFPSSPGMSGGPLFNERGEVAGILSSTNNRETIFVSFRATRLAYDTCRPNKNPILRVFTSAACQPCILFRRHLVDRPAFRQRIEQRYTIIFVDIDKDPAAAKEAGVTDVPTFVPEGKPPVVGYQGPDALVDQLEGKPVERPSVVIPPPAAAQPAPSATPPPASAAQPPAAGSQPTLADKVDRLAGLVQTGVTVASWLGIAGASGGTAWAAWAGLSLLRRVLGRSKPVATQQPSMHLPPATQPVQVQQPPTVITTENPPPPQVVIPENHFVPVQVDAFAQAYQWAEKQAVQKFPASGDAFSYLRSLINQYMASFGYRTPGSGF